MPSHSLPYDLSPGHEVLPPFESLYDRYHVQVYRYVYAHLGNEHDAADVLQQIFLQVWKQRQTYDPDDLVSRFYDALTEKGVRVANGAWFGDEARVFRLGFGLLALPDLQAALHLLSEVAQRLMHTNA